MRRQSGEEWRARYVLRTEDVPNVRPRRKDRMDVAAGDLESPGLALWVGGEAALPLACSV